MSDTCIKHIEQAWKLKTQLSNDLFNEGKFENSLSGYQEALCRAEVLNNNLVQAKGIGIPVIQIFAISCNNMAYTYEKIGMIENGEKMLKRVIYFLLLQSNSKSLSSAEIQNELKRAMLNYTEFANRNSIEIENTQKVFSDIQEQFKTYETI
ncbi:MAG: tetratricopeptide repeat protein [Aequorivita sp.]